MDSRLSMLVALCAVAMCGSAAAGPRPAAGESQIKSAFLYNFTKFVEWPDAALPRRRADRHRHPRRKPLTAELEAIVAGRKVNGRAIEMRAIAWQSKATQMLFVTRRRIAVRRDANFLATARC